jgi:hypothetical protein
MDTNCQIAAASVIGREHRRTDRPCQDAFAVRRGERAVVAVVCDGCGSGAHSELGARLGANLLAAALVRRLDRGEAVAAVATWRGACDEVVARLAGLVPLLGDDARAAIARHLLFTVLAAAVTADGAAILAIGDGVIVVDGVPRVLEADDNAPAYLGYELLGAPAALELTAPPSPSSIVLGTDGALPLLGELVALDGDDRLFTHPDALRRKLAIAGREPGLLGDDATVVALRRRAA